jgi:hypothetical protein
VDSRDAAEQFHWPCVVDLLGSVEPQLSSLASYILEYLELVHATYGGNLHSTLLDVGVFAPTLDPLWQSFHVADFLLRLSDSTLQSRAVRAIRDPKRQDL